MTLPPDGAHVHTGKGVVWIVDRGPKKSIIIPDYKWSHIQKCRLVGKKVNKQESTVCNRFHKFPGQSHNHFYVVGLMEKSLGWSYIFRTH